MDRNTPVYKIFDILCSTANKAIRKNTNGWPQLAF